MLGMGADFDLVFRNPLNLEAGPFCFVASESGGVTRADCDVPECSGINPSCTKH